MQPFENVVRMSLVGRVQPVNVQIELSLYFKVARSSPSFTYHIQALRLIRWGPRLGRTCSGLLDLYYILELEWICGENGHTLRIIPGDQNPPMAVWYPGFN